MNISTWLEVGGPIFLGICLKFIKDALTEVIENGTSFCVLTVKEVLFAQLICEVVPSVEMVRLVNSGTEATMSAVRLARAYTERTKIIKFAGGYQGHFDAFLVAYGSGALTFGILNTPGLTNGIARDTLIAAYNNLEFVEKLVEENRNQIAGIIVEPVPRNMGVVPPKDGFLSGLRKIADAEGIVLIFDEVMTGFRLARGGAQELDGIRPDLTTFGKVVGGRLPIGAFGGKREIMELLALIDPAYQARTLIGNPLAIGRGLAALRYIKDNPHLYANLNLKSKLLADGLHENLNRFGEKYALNYVGSMMTLFFYEGEVYNLETAKKSDIALFAKYFYKMLEKGIYLSCSQFEDMFVPLYLIDEEIQFIVKSNFEALKEILG